MYQSIVTTDEKDLKKNLSFMVDNFHYLIKIKESDISKKVIIQNTGNWFSLLADTMKVPVKTELNAKNILLITNNEDLAHLVLKTFEPKNKVRILTFNNEFNFKNTISYRKGIIAELAKVNNFIKISEVDIFLDFFEINSVNYSLYKDFIFEISSYISEKVYISFFQRKFFFNEFLMNFLKKLLLIYLAKQNYEKTNFSILECGEFAKSSFEYEVLQYLKWNGQCENTCFFTSYENLINNLSFNELDDKLKIRTIFDMEVKSTTLVSIITDELIKLNSKKFYPQVAEEYFEIFDLYEQLIYQLKIMPVKNFVQQCLIPYLNEQS